MTDMNSRMKVFEFIKTNPGIYLRELQREMKRIGIKGSAQYNILMLLQSKDIYSVKYGNNQHLFVSDFNKEKVWVPIFMQYPIPELIFTALEGDHAMSGKMIVGLVNESKDTVYYHLRRMVEKKVLEVRKENTTKFFTLAQ